MQGLTPLKQVPLCLEYQKGVLRIGKVVSIGKEVVTYLFISAYEAKLGIKAAFCKAAL